MSSMRPDPSQPGAMPNLEPMDPERGGWHWCQMTPNVIAPIYWNTQHWLDIDAWGGGPIAYLGPCLTPSEMDARIKQARRDALEAAARVAEEHEKKAQAKLDELALKFFSKDLPVGRVSSSTAMIVNSRKIAAAILALNGEGDE